MAELQHGQLLFEKIDPSNHAFDPSEREPRYAVIVNRTSPSSHTRGHGNVLFYAEPLLDHYAARGVPVINGVGAWRFEKSKALQVSLFERLGVAYPRTIVLNHRDQVMKLARGLRFPILVKPNIGGSGTGIARFESLAALEAGLNVLDFGPDATALLQEYIEPVGGAIVRVEVLDRECLYAIRIVCQADRFNLCPADLCQTDGAPGPLAACPGTTTSALTITRVDAPRAVTETVCRISRAASIDVGGVEYLVGRLTVACTFTTSTRHQTSSRTRSRCWASIPSHASWTSSSAWPGGQAEHPSKGTWTHAAVGPDERADEFGQCAAQAGPRACAGRAQRSLASQASPSSFNVVGSGLPVLRS